MNILFYLLIAILLVLFLEVHLDKKRTKKIDEAKIKLEENAGIKFNHSYRLIDKRDESILYLRVFSIYVLNKEVKVKCFLTTKTGEIGIWDDKIEILYNIKDNYNLEDCGEW